MDQKAGMGTDPPALVHLVVGKAFAPSLLHPFPISLYLFKRQIIYFIQAGKIEDDKCNSALFLKFPHKFNLVGMDILKGKCLYRAFLGIKTHRNPLYGPDIIHGTLLVKIGQGDVAAGLVNFNGGDGSRYLLYQSQLLFPLQIVGMVNQIFKGRAP